MILAFEVGRQYIFIGAVNGLSYALLALGVILIYRSSRIINFAVGATGVLASQVLAHLVIRYGAPYWLGVVLAVLGGAVFLGVAELTVVRRLFTAPRVILLVATIGLAQLAQALIFALPEASAEDKRHRFPTPWNRELEWFGIRIEGGELSCSWLRPRRWWRSASGCGGRRGVGPSGRRRPIPIEPD